MSNLNTLKNSFGKGDTSWFTHSRFGMFIHWGLYSLGARHEWLQHRECIPREAYRKYFELFEPDLYDPKKWARDAREAGMEYFVITTKHHEGFCLWDTKFTDYKATNTPIGTDLLRPMVDAFRSEGLKVGFYYSLIDWHHPDFTVDRLHPLRNDGPREKQNRGKDMKRYAAYMRDQVRELLTEFGKIDILWFDFSYTGEDGKGHEDWESEKLVQMIRELQPEIMLDNRLDLEGVGDFVTPEQFQPHEAPKDQNGAPLVWEGCQTFSGSWGYHRDESSWKSTEQILWMLIDGVSKGGNLLMNVGPTGRGEFDGRARSRLKEIGEWMRLHRRSIVGCGVAPESFKAPTGCRYTYNPQKHLLYLHLFEWPFGAVHLPEMKGKVKYAQFLNDASEIQHRDDSVKVGEAIGDHQENTASGYVTLNLPTQKPNVAVPVIEIFLVS